MEGIVDHRLVALKEWTESRPEFANVEICEDELKGFVIVSTVFPSLSDPDEYLRQIYGRMRPLSATKNVCVRIRREQNRYNPNYRIETWTGTPRSRAMWKVGEYSGRTHKPLPAAYRHFAYWSDFEMEFDEIEALFARVRGVPYPPKRA